MNRSCVGQGGVSVSRLAVVDSLSSVHFNLPTGENADREICLAGEDLRIERSRVLVSFGTRPEAIKLAPLIRQLQADVRFEPIVAVTGQHRARC